MKETNLKPTTMTTLKIIMIENEFCIIGMTENREYIRYDKILKSEMTITHAQANNMAVAYQLI